MSETPAEPEGSTLAQQDSSKRVSGYRAQRHPVRILGPGEPPAFPHFDCFVAPDEYTFAFKGHSSATGCRRSKSVSIPRTHRFCIASSKTKMRRETMANSFAVRRRTRNMPMTKVLREYRAARKSRQSGRLRVSASQHCVRSTTCNSHARDEFAYFRMRSSFR